MGTSELNAQGSPVMDKLGSHMHMSGCEENSFSCVCSVRMLKPLCA